MLERVLHYLVLMRFDKPNGSHLLVSEFFLPALLRSIHLADKDK